MSERPTVSEVRQFLEETVRRLNIALSDVRVSFGGSLLADHSLTSNWKHLISRCPDLPDDISAAYDMVTKTRNLAKGGHTEVTRAQLIAARQCMARIRDFLRHQFPSAGVEMPDQSEIDSLGRLIARCCRTKLTDTGKCCECGG